MPMILFIFELKDEKNERNRIPTVFRLVAHRAKTKPISQIQKKRLRVKIDKNLKSVRYLTGKVKATFQYVLSKA